MDIRDKSFFGLLFLLAALVTGPAVPRASADVMYTYTGNAFDTFPTGASCPPVCNVTGSFVVAAPLAANLPELTLIDPISFSLTSAGVTLTDGEGQGTDSSLAVATDSTGAIIEWAWVEVGPASNPTARILTENVPASVADDVRVGTSPPPFVGPRLGQISDDPGTWTEAAVAPEPASLSLVAIGLLGMVASLRKTRP
jgi:PEP-CTERM motif